MVRFRVLARLVKRLGKEWGDTLLTGDFTLMGRFLVLIREILRVVLASRGGGAVGLLSGTV